VEKRKRRRKSTQRQPRVINFLGSKTSILPFRQALVARR